MAYHQYDCDRDNLAIESETFGSYMFGQSMLENVRDKVFLIESKSGKCITFGELQCQSHSLARAMLSLMSFGPNDICVIMSESSIQYVVIIGACLLLNVPYTSVAPAYGPYQLAKQLIETKSKYLFISRELSDRVERMFANEKYSYLRKKIKIFIMDYNSNDNPLSLEEESYSTVEKLVSAFQGQQHRIQPVPYYDKSLNDTVTIVYTSGSTGKPKGACHNHKSILSNIIHMKRLKVIRQYAKDPMLLTFPLGHVSGNISVFLAMISLTPVVLLNYKNIDTIFNTIQKYRIGQIFGAPNVANVLVKDKQSNDDISSLKMILTAGSKLPQNTGHVLNKQFNIALINCYGSTECLYVSLSESGEVVPNVGRALDCFQVKIAPLKNDKHSNNNKLTAEQTGEICIRGQSVFREYFLNPEETSKVIDQDGWYHTGDVGYLDLDGNLVITDRIKEIIKFQGWSVFPADIECFLMTHQAIRNAVVVPVKHSSYNQVPRAYVQLKDDYQSQVNTDQLHKFVKDNMGFHQHLRGGIIFLDQLKYTTMGKIDRQYFKALCVDEVLHSLEE